MKDNIKNKNLFVIVFEVMVITLGIVGITYATGKLLNDRTSTVIKTGEYAIDYQGDKEVNYTELSPISDNQVDINSKDNVIRLAFSLKGARQNKEENLIYDVMLNEMSIDCSLLNKYTKWRLYKNGSLLTEGNFDPSFDGAVFEDNMHLTTIQQDLPKYNQEYDNYILIIWISESCEDLENCELVDQSDIIDSHLSMNVFIALSGGKKTPYNRLASLDNSCANSPTLAKNMIPVTYKDGSWIVADKNNRQEEYKWYDYNNAMWANSVVVSNDSNYDTVGTTIDNQDVLAAYVWIPRYRYKLWNAESEIKDSYNAYDNGIDIIFENGLSTKTNDIKNNNYITHPVFADKLKGFWLSKYELSKTNKGYQFISNVDSYTSDSLENYKNIINELNNTYKIGNDANIHMVSNLEWGSALYLSHSKYGVCKTDGCDSIATNETYTSGANKQDTTTRNVYGIYDMAGSASEYVLGASTIGTATSEVLLSNNRPWYNALGLLSNRDYILRGGINRGMFYFGDISMSETKYGTRSSITN